MPANIWGFRLFAYVDLPKSTEKVFPHEKNSQFFTKSKERECTLNSRLKEIPFGQIFNEKRNIFAGCTI